MVATRESQFVSTLPGRFYYDPTIYQMEVDRIFSRQWICIGRAEQIPQPGDYFTERAGRENVLAVRGTDGQVRVFLNVCRHRGALVCDSPCGHVNRILTCRYHAWGYGLDGNLVTAPNVMDDDAFNKDQYGLVPVATTIWEGYIWINLSDQPNSFQDQVVDVIVDRFGGYEKFGRYHIGELAIGKRIEYDVHANWKIVVENFQECYHCAPMHPEFVRLLPGYIVAQSSKGAPYRRDDEFGGVAYADGVETFTIDGRAPLPRLKGLQPEDDRKYYAWYQPPNVFINLISDHVIYHMFYPTAPDRTRVVCDWLFDPETVADSEMPIMEAVTVFDIVNKQDWEVCEMCQGNMTSKVYQDGGLFVPVEQHIREFNDWVLICLGMEEQTKTQGTRPSGLCG